MEFPRVETARYSACLRDNTLDGCSLLFYTFRRLSPTSTRDKEDKKKKEKAGRPVRCRIFRDFRGRNGVMKARENGNDRERRKKEEGREKD